MVALVYIWEGWGSASVDLFRQGEGASLHKKAEDGPIRLQYSLVLYKVRISFQHREGTKGFHRTYLYQMGGLFILGPAQKFSIART